MLSHRIKNIKRWWFDMNTKNIIKLIKIMSNLKKDINPSITNNYYQKYVKDNSYKKSKIKFRSFVIDEYTKIISKEIKED